MSRADEGCVSGSKSGNDLSEQLLIFLAGFLIDFDCGKPTGKIINDDPMT